LKYLIVFIVVAGFAWLAACESEPKPAATLLNNEEVHRAFQHLKDASEKLNGDTDRFDDENWREVVPDVKSAAAEVSDAAAELEKALGYRQ
jgi:hypothetical protein